MELTPRFNSAPCSEGYKTFSAVLNVLQYVLRGVVARHHCDPSIQQTIEKVSANKCVSEKNTRARRIHAGCIGTSLCRAILGDCKTLKRNELRSDGGMHATTLRGPDVSTIVTITPRTTYFHCTETPGGPFSEDRLTGLRLRMPFSDHRLSV